MPKKKTWQVPRVLFGPEVRSKILRGSKKITAAVAPTLGPLPRMVLNETAVRNRAPEFLDSGGVIARRIIQIPERTEDVGAMMLRHALWRLQEAVGDGATTTALIYQALLEEGARYLAAGGNAMTLRPQLEAALRLALETLGELSHPLRGRAQLQNLARMICRDQELANLLAEVMDITGALGTIELHKSQDQELRCEYRQGSYWDNSALLSPARLNDIPNQRAFAENAAVLLTDLELDAPQDLSALFQATLENGANRLLLVTRKISEAALGVLSHPQNLTRLEVFVAQTPGVAVESQTENLADLALLTGASPLLGVAGDRWQQVAAERLGHARQIWVSKHHLGLVGGQSDPLQLRQHIQMLQGRYHQADKIADKTRLQKRIGRLQGGAATIYIGGATATEVETRFQLAERLALAIRGALLEGVVPGGGSALLVCASRLEKLARQAADTDTVAAYRMAAHAFRQPSAVLAANAGLRHSPALAAVRQSASTGQTLSLDVVSQQAVDPHTSGLLDSTGALKAIVHSAVASAALALTTEVVIHHRNPAEAYET